MSLASLHVGSLFFHSGVEEGLTVHPLQPHRLRAHCLLYSKRSVTQVSVQASLVYVVVEVTELPFQTM